MTGDSVPIGRRVAYLRARRKLSQQSFADRLGKSKSWVDKVERGVRSLERVSTIRDIAAILRVETATLLGRDAQPAELAERTEGISRIRAALSTYGMAFGQPVACRDASPDQLSRAVGHAWSTQQPCHRTGPRSASAGRLTSHRARSDPLADSGEAVSEADRRRSWRSAS
ncbi:helix-turn-helix domain-containing protein [Micromonospora sp. NPDC049460]|uniref:helix-turn-helix domain-containing protein n=1 Tax=unclassified Micromonospora TaxID=2617518 RepID=UPI00371027D5